MSPHDAAVGSTLPGLARPVGVERTSQPPLRLEVDLAEHQRHEVALFETDAVLAGQHSPGRDRHPDDLFAGRVDAIHDARFALVEDQQRVEVAVAGVEHVHDEQVVPLDDLVDLFKTSGRRRRGTTVSCR